MRDRVLPPRITSSCYDPRMNAVLWVVIVLAGIVVLDFVFGVVGIASFIFSSNREK